MAIPRAWAPDRIRPSASQVLGPGGPWTRMSLAGGGEERPVLEPVSLLRRPAEGIERARDRAIGPRALPGFSKKGLLESARPLEVRALQGHGGSAFQVR